MAADEDLGLLGWCSVAEGLLARNCKVSERTFRSFFGVSVKTCQAIYSLYLYKTKHHDPRDLLWTLDFLKNYETSCGTSKIQKCERENDA